MLDDFDQIKGSLFRNEGTYLKGDRNPNVKYVNKEEHYKPCIMIPVLSKSDEKWGSCGCLKFCKCTVMEAAIL